MLGRQGMLWSCSDNSGLMGFDTHTRKFTAYLMDPNQPGSQGANWTGDVYSDGASLWVASPKGLFRFDPGTGKFTRHYTEKNGLPSNSVVSVQSDALGNIWVSTIKGLSRFDAKKDTFRNYDAYDGLQGNDFFPRCSAKTPDGRLFFGGLNGLNAFYPEMLADNPNPPPVVLTDFELFNKPARVGGEGSPLRQSINVASSITLRYDQSVFRFEFAALDFTAPLKNRYAYRLDGFDKDWQYTDATRRLARYTNLDPGEYTFRVKASNNDGVWNERGVALHLTIVPPWWKTKWFRGLCLVAFLVVAWAAYRLRVRVLENRQRALERHQGEITALNERLMKAQEEERVRIAGELHDGFLQQLTSLTLRMGSVALRLPADSEAKTKIKDLQGQMMQMGANLRHLSHELHPPALHDAGLAAALCAYCEEFSKVRGVPVSCEVDETIDDLSPRAALVLYRIAQEALGNIAKHSEAQHAQVRLSRRDGDVQLFVSDDGIGFEPSDITRTGLGMINMRERVHQLNGTFEFDSKPGLGTTIRAIVPFRPVF
jgi:signal transduction histidine kinase